MIISYIALTLILCLYAFDLLLFVRAICSWIPSSRGSYVYRLSFSITEPVLRPVRDVFMRWEFARRCPIDLSFIAVVILCSLAQRLLYIFI